MSTTAEHPDFPADHPPASPSDQPADLEDSSTNSFVPPPHNDVSDKDLVSPLDTLPTQPSLKTKKPVDAGSKVRDAKPSSDQNADHPAVTDGASKQLQSSPDCDNENVDAPCNNDNECDSPGVTNDTSQNGTDQNCNVLNIRTEDASKTETSQCQENLSPAVIDNTSNQGSNQDDGNMMNCATTEENGQTSGTAEVASLCQLGPDMAISASAETQEIRIPRPKRRRRERSASTLSGMFAPDERLDESEEFHPSAMYFQDHGNTSCVHGTSGGAASTLSDGPNTRKQGETPKDQSVCRTCSAREQSEMRITRDVIHKLRKDLLRQDDGGSVHLTDSFDDFPEFTLDLISKLTREILRKDDGKSIEIIESFDDCPEMLPKDHGKRELLPRPAPVSLLWTFFTEDILHAGILSIIIFLTRFACRNPYTTIGSIVFLSFALVTVGFFTNFVMIFDHEIIFTPVNSLPTKHGDWIYQKAGFEDASEVFLIIHADGSNIMHVDAMRRAFEALDTFRSTDGYDELCEKSTYINLKGKPDCWVFSPTEFWDHDIEKFNAAISDDYHLVQAISQDTFPDGMPVFKDAVFGKHATVPDQFVNKKGKNVTFDMLTYAPNFIVNIGLPDTTEGEYFQEAAMERLKELKKRWDLEDSRTNPDGVHLEFFTFYAYLLEYERALTNDMPLVPLTFYVMLLFTCLTFHRLGMSSRKSPTGVDPSRFCLGLLSIFTIGMSLMTGYGFMFCLGIPFTNLCQMVPFIILGVGLDDTFIITGAYFRKLAEADETETRVGDNEGKDHNEITTERIVDVMKEVGLSITLTSLTTIFAFFLGCGSTIPGIQWVCLYAGVTISVDFLYQVSLFVAFLTLDERRVHKARERAEKQEDYLFIGNIFGRMRSTLPREEISYDTVEKEDGDDVIFTKRIMSWYADQLLRPAMKRLVVVVFLGLFAWSVWRTTLLRQAFNVEDYVPADSYTKTFFSSLENYSSLKMQMTVYFRNINQSDPIIQEQMREYIAALASLPQIQRAPDFCWVQDLHALMSGEISEDMTEDQAAQVRTIAAAVRGENRTFAEQLDMVLGIPIIREVYGGDIVRDEHGEILTSRCALFVRHIDLKSIGDQTKLLFDQRAITADFQPTISSSGDRPGKDGELSFFAFDELFYYWELYTVAVKELIFTTISGVVAVNVVGFLFIPHWTAVLFVCPIIIMLYFFLLGTLQACGVFINAVTYVTVVIAIGLLVDYVMHILMKYYESPGATRDEKVKETLETMGASMLMGGFTTWLGVIPLALSTTKVFRTIFIAFMAMASWGLLVSLVFMPVILSYCGPVVCTVGPRPATSFSRMARLKLPPSVGGDDDDDFEDSDDDDSGILSSSLDTTIHIAAQPRRKRKPGKRQWLGRPHSLRAEARGENRPEEIPRPTSMASF